MTDECPNGCDLQGPPIPEKHRQHYGDETHFSRRVGVYDLALDRTMFWRCPDCGVEWDRPLR